MDTTSHSIMANGARRLRDRVAKKNEIILFEANDGKVALPVQFNAETVWLTQAQMATLFNKDRTVIGRHIRNAIAEGEIDTKTMCAKFAHAQAVGVIAPFYLVKLFKDHFADGASIINISSSRDRMSQPQSESYTAAKGGIAALTHALAASLSGRVRVNSISPGWIDTTGKQYDGPDAAQHFAGRVGNPMDIANMVLYLASDKAGFITGENICIDGGMTRNMIYHNDFGWKLEK